MQRRNVKAVKRTVGVRRPVVLRRPKMSRPPRPRTMSAPRRAVGVPLQRAPEIVRNNSMQITITHTERMADVTAAVINTNHSLVINPKRPETFPWLSKIAEAFDMYRILKLSVFYRPSCPTTTKGELIMAFDYDPTDDNSESSINDLAAMRGSATGPLYAPSSVNFELSAIPQSTHKFYCAIGGSPDRLNDVATLWYNATSDAPVVGGALFISYTIQLVDAEAVTSSYGLTTGMKSLTVASVTEANLLGTTQQFVANVATTALTQALNKVAVPAIARFFNYISTTVWSWLSFRTHADLLSLVDTTRMREVETSGFTTTQLGVMPFLDDATLTVHVIKPDACSDWLLIAPIYGTFTPTANAAPIVRIQCSENLAVSSSIAQFTGSFAAGVPVITFGCVWYVLKFQAGLHAWYRLYISNGTWSTASTQSWQLISVPDVQQWVPKTGY